jgi:hypothetical protein
MGAVVRYMTDGRSQWLARLRDKPMDYGYVTDRNRAHVFPSREAAQRTAFMDGRSYRRPTDVEIISVQG